jgi:hypothetical protein
MSPFFINGSHTPDERSVCQIRDAPSPRVLMA